jgi:hypothetical protein
MADYGLAVASENNDLVAGIEAMVFARMAALTGNGADVQRQIAGFTLLDRLVHEASFDEYRDELRGEAVAIVSLLADAGDADSDRLLPLFAETVSARANEVAKIVRERIIELGDC